MRYLLYVAIVLISGCALPPLQDRTTSQALSLHQAQHTNLGRSIAPLTDTHPGLSGIHALADAHDAFAVRGLLIQAAEKSLDIQYYIWRDDTTGKLLLHSLQQAADKGVRIRLLLDDNGISKRLGQKLLLLNEHPKIEVRLFNPFVWRRPKALNYLSDFKRLNHRMHNKSFTVDNIATVVGGRNIGDEYFGATDQIVFADLDVLAFGEVVRDVSADFDNYWASPLAYPIEQIVTATGRFKQLQLSELNLIDNINTRTAHARVNDYLSILKNSDTIQNLIKQRLPIEWVKTEMVSDDPAKAEGKVSKEQTLTYQLQHAIGSPAHQVDLVSPYFVPTKTGVENFKALLSEPTMQLRILTNSYEATDVAAVHAGYIKRRKALVRAGAELYEMKLRSSSNLKKRMKRNQGSAKGTLGSSGTSLHAKTFAVDQKRVFIGSFNFDPRSANLNTELGFVIHSPNLAKEISTIFDQQVPYSSYQVILNKHQQLRWLERHTDDDEIDHVKTHEVEPGTNLFSRWWVVFMSKLPIEWML